MPIISLKHKFIVLLNSKCGSTYLQDKFKAYHDFPIHIHRHTTALNMKNILESRGYNFDDFFVIITIRPVYDHIISAFYQDMLMYKKNKNSKFDKYKTNINLYIENEQLDHFTSIKNMICDNHDMCLVDHIFDIKDIKNLLKLLEEKYNIQISVSDIRNKRNIKLFDKVYTIHDLENENIEKLKNVYKYDCKYFENKLEYKRNNKILIKE
jgi:hypothetical protein